MNLMHRWLCSSSHWKHIVETQILPWTLDGLELGSNILEVGPGYGATTELLQSRVERLTCVEMNLALAEQLRRRTAGQNVTVLCESATEMSLPNAVFDGAMCFTMLHHVPSRVLQDQLFAEVARVLRPGGIFAGTDSRYSRVFSLLHLFDTMVVVDPSILPDRLRAVGFEDIHVDVHSNKFRFRARKPSDAITQF